MTYLRDGRVITWLILLAVGLASVITFANTRAISAVATTPVTESAAQAIVTDLDYSLYQGVSAGANRAGVGQWVQRVELLAEQGLALRTREVPNPGTDSLALAFTRLSDTAAKAQESLTANNVNAASVRRQVIQDITYLTAVAQGKPVTAGQARPYYWSDAPIQPQPVQPPPNPTSPAWPFPAKEQP